MLFDIGANLTHSDFKDDLQTVLDRAKTASVLQMAVTGASLEGSKQAIALSEQFEGLYATVGVHPHHAEEINDETLQMLAALARSPSVVAIGETGLDYFRSEGAQDWQKDRFAVHIAVGKALQKPVIVHCRHAAADTVEIIKTEGAHECGGVMHCFAEDWATAREVIDQGFYISFSGILTFKNRASSSFCSSYGLGTGAEINFSTVFVWPIPYGEAADPWQ